MATYEGKVRGEFEKTQRVEANSIEEATELLKSNVGEDMEETATGILEVMNVEELG